MINTTKKNTDFILVSKYCFNEKYIINEEILQIGKFLNEEIGFFNLNEEELNAWSSYKGSVDDFLDEFKVIIHYLDSRCYSNDELDYFISNNNCIITESNELISNRAKCYFENIETIKFFIDDEDEIIIDDFISEVKYIESSNSFKLYSNSICSKSYEDGCWDIYEDTKSNYIIAYAPKDSDICTDDDSFIEFKDYKLVSKEIITDIFLKFESIDTARDVLMLK